jgi:transketolase
MKISVNHYAGVIMDDIDLQNKAINTIRFLSADMVQKANSGHPGLPMGAAAMAYTIWTRHLRHNPLNPDWIDRDRFILSGGHGSALLYSLLHLTGYKLSLDDLKEFRQWGSLTPGHPEKGLTPGVETTTGPLGQGFSNGVGFAIAEQHLAAEFNTTGNILVDHYVYAIVTDGDQMEGVASESASLAGHLKLGKLIYLYDDNRISIDGSTELAFTEDRRARFEAYGWHTQLVEDGNDVESLDSAIQKAKIDPRPSIILCRTQIGFGLPTRQNTPKAHGEPPGEEELNGAKKNLNWPVEPKFFIPEDVLAHFRKAIKAGKELEDEWNERLICFRKEFPEKANEFIRRVHNKLPEDWESYLPSFPADEKGMASRAASGKVINNLAGKIPELIGGSADLAPSNLTWINNYPAYQADSPKGRNFHFGVREHGMGAVVNGMALHQGLIPYGATFLVFSDYMRGALRISALSHIPSIWIFTHDSIGLGEDGPTHQPVEHLASLRAIPNFSVIRPADANETSEAWKVAIKHRNGPTALILSRQSIPTLDRKIYAPASNLYRGAYILADLGAGKPELILMASGSEVHLILQAALKLVNTIKSVRVVSFPSWDLFKEQELEYKSLVLPPDGTPRLVVEMGVSQGWERWLGSKGSMITIDHFGASAPANILFEKFGFTVENVIKKAQELIS